MNVELLRKIAAVIQEKPAEFDMRSFTGVAKCGTTHCIGGWAEHLTKQIATAALGISEEQAARLFYITDGNGDTLWPDKFLGRKKRGKTIRESWWLPTPKQAAARIEHFIATGGAE